MNAHLYVLSCFLQFLAFNIDATIARKDDARNGVIQRLENLEVFARRSNAKLSQLERTVLTQAHTINELNNNMHHLRRIVHTQQTHISNLNRKARVTSRAVIRLKKLFGTSSWPSHHGDSRVSHHSHKAQSTHSSHRLGSHSHLKSDTENHFLAITGLHSIHPGKDHTITSPPTHISHSSEVNQITEAGVHENNTRHQHNHTHHHHHHHHQNGTNQSHKGSNASRDVRNNQSSVTSDGHHHNETHVHTTTLPESPVHDHDISGSNTPRHNRATSRRQGFGGIAFSAYLDHDVTLGQHQTLKFNKVLVNDGTGYSPNTGVFTCPEGGTYMFTFVIGQRDANHYMWAELVLNSANVIDVAVDTYHQYQDLQGGNTVILKLKQGDEVWVDATHNGSHVEGSTTLRLSTFTGLYLYSE